MTSFMLKGETGVLSSQPPLHKYTRSRELHHHIKFKHAKVSCKFGRCPCLRFIIIGNVAIFFCRVIIGLHNNMVSNSLFNPRAFLHQILAASFPKLVLGEEHSKHFTPIWKQFKFLLQETGYLHIQATKPDTVGMFTGFAIV